MITYQTATKSDCQNIATLHANSWQQNNRCILDDNFLDKLVQQERLAVWAERFKNPSDNQHIITAKDQQQLCGFTCIYKGKDSKYGTYLDNLHVAKEWQGKGIGKRLMQLAGQWSQQYYPNQGLHLFVFMANTAAIRFYEQIGGQRKEIRSYDLGDGTDRKGNVGVYYWEKPWEI